MLIIALVVLSILIYFVVKGMTTSQEKFNEASEPGGVAVVNYYASSDYPLLFQQESYSVRRGGSVNAIVSVYNTGWNPEKDITVEIVSCLDEYGNVEEGITFVAMPQAIAENKAVGFKVLLTATDKVLNGKYICDVISGYADESGSVDTESEYKTAQLSVEVII